MNELNVLSTPEEQQLFVEQLMASFTKLKDLKIDPVSWIWPDFLINNGFNMLVSEPGGLKSMLALSTAIGIAQGKLFDQPVQARPVIYIDKENSKDIVVDRAMRLGLEDESLLFYWGGWHSIPPPANTADPIYQLLAKQFKPVMVFDSLIRFANGKEENDATQMSTIFNALVHLRNLGATILLLHHKGKPHAEGPASAYRGSSEIHAGPDVAITMDKKKEDTGWCLTLQGFKTRNQEEKAVRFHFDTEAFRFRAESTPAPDADAILIHYALKAQPGLGINEIVIKTKLSDKAVRKILATYEGELWLQKNGASNKFSYFPLDSTT